MLTFDPEATLRSVCLALGGALMWYAVISGVAARLPGRGPLIAGLAWGVFPVLAGLFHAHSFPIWLHDVIYALNFLNPMAWLGGTTPQGNSSILPFGVLDARASANGRSRSRCRRQRAAVVDAGGVT